MFIDYFLIETTKKILTIKLNIMYYSIGWHDELHDLNTVDK